MSARTPPSGLTLEALRNALAVNPCPPVVYYIVSSALPVQEQHIVRVANDGMAPLPYDLVCHPDQLPALQTALAGVALLRPHANPRWRQNIEHMVASWSPAPGAWSTNRLSPRLS